MSSADAQALCIPDAYAHGPAEAFIDDHEFCHLHPGPNGGLHLTLPDHLRPAVIEAGWAEEHPAVRAGVLPRTVVMLYGPRTEQELAVIVSLVEASRQFAVGGC